MSQSRQSVIFQTQGSQRSRVSKGIAINPADIVVVELEINQVLGLELMMTKKLKTYPEVNEPIHVIKK